MLAFFVIHLNDAPIFTDESGGTVQGGIATRLMRIINHARQIFID
jgi:hypothetical protein